jgi:hypothetical protein
MPALTMLGMLCLALVYQYQTLGMIKTFVFKEHYTKGLLDVISPEKAAQNSGSRSRIYTKISAITSKR